MMSPVRKPSLSTLCTAPSMAAASASISKARRSIIAADRIVASGLALPCPAMSGAEPWMARTGRDCPCRGGGRQHTDGTGDDGSFVGEDVTEEVAGHDDVELRRIAHQLHGGIVHIEMGQFHIEGIPCPLRSSLRAKRGTRQARWPYPRSTPSCGACGPWRRATRPMRAISSSL